MLAPGLGVPWRLRYVAGPEHPSRTHANEQTITNLLSGEKHLAAGPGLAELRIHLGVARASASGWLLFRGLRHSHRHHLPIPFSLEHQSPFPPLSQSLQTTPQRLKGSVKGYGISDLQW